MKASQFIIHHRLSFGEDDMTLFIACLLINHYIMQ